MTNLLDELEELRMEFDRKVKTTIEEMNELELAHPDNVRIKPYLTGRADQARFSILIIERAIERIKKRNDSTHKRT